MEKVIEIDLDSSFEYINEFDDNRMNDKLCKYILDSIVNLKENIVLKIKFNYNPEKSEINNIQKIFNDTFERNIEQINKELKRFNVRDFVLLCLGVLFLVLYWFLDEYDIFVFAEMFMIFGWVAFWEIAESILFNRRDFVLKKKKYVKLLNARFEFVE